MEERTTNVFIAGVGGQGILLASEILSEMALARGLDVKKSEVHGMAQRGGSVVSHVRFGEKVYSPVIAEGEADVLVSFEKMEAVRWVHYVSPAGTVVVNDQRVVPSGMEQYPEGISDELRKRVPGAHVLDRWGYLAGRDAARLTAPLNGGMNAIRSISRNGTAK